MAADSAYAASNSSTVNLARGISTSLALTASPGTTVQVGQTVQLTATVIPNSYNGVTATGTVTFYDGSTQIGSQTLNSSWSGGLYTGVLGQSHLLGRSTAGDSTFAAATGGVLVRALLTLVRRRWPCHPTALTVVDGRDVYGNSAGSEQSPVTTGQVQFCDATATYCEDAAVLGNAQLTSTGTAAVSLRLGLGSHSVKAMFGGNANDAGSVSSNQSVAVTGQLPSATSLAVGGVVGNYTLTATVTGSANAAPTGAVTFKDASNSNSTVATASLDSQTAVAGFPATSYGVGTYPQAIAVGDFNGDGIPDLVVANSNSNSVGILLGNGDGTFKPQQTYATGYYPSAIVVGDFNGDGKLDLAVANSSGSSVSVLLGNGDGTFQPQQAYTTSYGVSSIAVGDFNNDGKLDLVETKLVRKQYRHRLDRQWRWHIPDWPELRHGSILTAFPSETSTVMAGPTSL